MDHSSRVTSHQSASKLRYRLKAGSTLQYDLRFDLAMEIRTHPDSEPETLDAEITATLDLEVVRAEDDRPAVVRLNPRDVGWYVRSSSTLDEEAVSDPLSGLPPAFLLDPQGRSTPLADTGGREIAPTDDRNAAPFILKALLPLYAADEVTPGDHWELELEHGSIGQPEPGSTRCEYLRIEQDDAGYLEPVIRHTYGTTWALSDEQGATAYTAETRISLRDGWPTAVRGRVEIDRHFGRTVVQLTATRNR